MENEHSIYTHITNSTVPFLCVGRQKESGCSFINVYMYKMYITDEFGELQTQWKKCLNILPLAHG